MPSVQPSGNDAGGGSKAGSPSRSARLGPSGQRGDVVCRQRPVVLERLAETPLGLPGRHRTISGHGRDIPGTLAGLFIVLERKGRDLSGTVAFLTVLLDDPRDLAGVGRGDGRPRSFRRGMDCPVAVLRIAAMSGTAAGAGAQDHQSGHD